MGVADRDESRIKRRKVREEKGLKAEIERLEADLEASRKETEVARRALNSWKQKSELFQKNRDELFEELQQMKKNESNLLHEMRQEYQQRDPDLPWADVVETFVEYNREGVLFPGLFVHS